MQYKIMYKCYYVQFQCNVWLIDCQFLHLFKNNIAVMFNFFDCNLPRTMHIHDEPQTP